MATKVLFISQEIAPYLPETPSSSLGRDLPLALAESGYEVRTFMPKYGLVNERRNQLHEVIRLSGLNIVIDDNDHPLVIKVATLLPVRMQVYFIDCDDFFHAPPVTELETVSEPANNDERSMFYVRGVAETVKKLRWEAAVIQCDGWLAALAPLYLRRLYPEEPAFKNARIVMTLRADSLPQDFDPRFAEKLLQEKILPMDLEGLPNPVGHDALMRLAIDNADAVMVAEETVDPALVAYAREKGKPVLDYVVPEERRQAMLDFYDSLSLIEPLRKPIPKAPRKAAKKTDGAKKPAAKKAATPKAADKKPAVKKSAAKKS